MEEEEEVVFFNKIFLKTYVEIAYLYFKNTSLAQGH